jgi:hypothetical protein
MPRITLVLFALHQNSAAFPEVVLFLPLSPTSEILARFRLDKNLVSPMRTAYMETTEPLKPRSYEEGRHVTRVFFSPLPPSFPVPLETAHRTCWSN